MTFLLFQTDVNNGSPSSSGLPTIDENELHARIDRMNTRQHGIFDVIDHAVLNNRPTDNNLFFIDAPGGTGALTHPRP